MFIGETAIVRRKAREELMQKREQDRNGLKKRSTVIENAAQAIAEDDCHEDIEFSSVNFSELNIADHSFENCTFSSCRFREMAIPGATFRSCVFKECEFVLTKLNEVTLNGAVFESCRIMGVNFSECSKFAFSPEFRGCVIDNAVFYGVSLKKGIILKCRLVDCDLTGCDFREADFSDTRFERVAIRQCNFEKADFRTSQGYAIDPGSNQVRKAKFSLPEAQSFLSFLGIDLED